MRTLPGLTRRGEAWHVVVRLAAELATRRIADTLVLACLHRLVASFMNGTLPRVGCSADDRLSAEDAGFDGLLLALLREQQSTAVDRFAHWHARQAPAARAGHYRDLVPLALPGPEEQYAFEVDLDACSGCKACVVACHNLNGLEEHETWRTVGLLHGGSRELPVLQHVTAACHHCLEPACLDGCPVEAYEKDAVTGIVRHLADRCIGCQYCIFKCPYDVPRYSARQGIVRKCDLCAGRLATGTPPACVQACPSSAIRVTTVSKHDIRENAEANLFLPGAPEPAYTLPSTVYRSRKALPANLLPADYFQASVQHAHWPLVLMLVLTQMSVGAFLVDQILAGLALPPGTASGRPWHLAAAFLLGMMGLLASVFHLGRPLRAHRALAGWRTSWLSREVLAFGLFAALSSAYAAFFWFMPRGEFSAWGAERLLGGAVALAGLAGVGCSTMIYASTRRAFWNAGYTGLKFFLTSVVLGIPLALLIQAAAGRLAGQPGQGQVPGFMRWLCAALACASAVKLCAEAAMFGWLQAPTFTPLKRTALLMKDALRRITTARFALGVVGGVLLPAWVAGAVDRLEGLPRWTWVGLVAALLGLNVAAEVLERYLFFAAVVAPKMPGARST